MSLIQWYMQVVNGDIAGARRQVNVVMYNIRGIPTMIWSFLDAYPVKWVGPTFTAGDSSVAFEELHFVHHGFTIETAAGLLKTGLQS
jgi:phage tail-like protein